MAYKVYGNMRFLPRSDTSANWEAANPVLERGEWGAVTGVNEAGDLLDTAQRMKVGDGVTPWNELPWWNGPQGPQGEKGDTGPQGPQGIQGPKGEAGVCKFIAVNELPMENIENAIYLLPVEGGAAGNLFDEYIYFDGVWERLGSVGVEVNLDEYVKNTDYATDSKAGVVKVQNYNSGLVMSNGSLMIASATGSNVIDKTNNRKPLTPNVIDKVVKVGLTTNTETLTDEEKASACEWLGALPINKETNDRIRAYVINRDGTQGVLQVDAGQGANKIVMTDGYGCLYVADPKVNNHATSKQYVDNAIVNNLTALAIPNVITDCGKSLTVNDVSPLAHKCSLKLTSDTYESVVGESNNIYDFNAENMLLGEYRGTVNTLTPPPSSMTYTFNDNGTITINGVTDPAGAGFGIQIHFYNLEQGKTYTFSLRSNQNEELYIEMLTANDWSSSSGSVSGSTLKCTFTVTDADGHHWCDIGCCAPDTDADYNIVDRQIENLILYPQLELGDTMTDWGEYGGGVIENRPYIEDFSTVKINVGDKSYTPTVDGTVTDIVSVAPTMEITTDNEYANIAEFTYCVDTKKYIDRKFEELRAEMQGG